MQGIAGSAWTKYIGHENDADLRRWPPRPMSAPRRLSAARRRSWGFCSTVYKNRVLRNATRPPA
jgi:hypothetical protein